MYSSSLPESYIFYPPFFYILSLALTVKQMTEAGGVTEALKADNPMEWVGRMNNIRNRAMEIVNTELIYRV